jgi:ElaB/YqjD/DUF883 family membrane-anchored ribosome-binding protein
MAAKDADMPTHHSLGDEVNEIAKHLQSLRKELEALTGSVARAGGHQAERAQDSMKEAVAAIEAAVRQNPIQGVGVALGIGFLLGIILRR